MNAHSSDTELLTALAALIRRVDAVPEDVRSAASASLSWRDPDAALAVLTADTTAAGAQLAGVRGKPPRLLTFEVDDVTIDLELTAEAGRVRVVGQLVPTGPAQITVVHEDGSRGCVADVLGRFVISDIPTGRVRVCCTPTGGRTLRTEWFTAGPA
jgi:hypothetical protein